MLSKSVIGIKETPIMEIANFGRAYSKETGKDVSANVEQLNTILDVYQPIVEKLTSWIGYGLVFIGLLLLVNVMLIMYLVIRK